jgi:putative flippase GtrA
MGQKQVVKFGMIGVLAVFTDMACYYVLLRSLPMDLLPGMGKEALAKTLSFLCGLAVTYSLNKRWTWGRTDRSARRLARFGTLYGASLLLNVGMNQALLSVFVKRMALSHGHLFAFLGATLTCAIWNFMGQKYWVFRQPTA